MLTDRQRRRKEYFEARGLRNPSADPSDRLIQALDLLEQTIPDFEAAFMLFDPEIDASNPDWLLLMGYIYRQPSNNPFHDDNKASVFSQKGYEIKDAFLSVEERQENCIAEYRKLQRKILGRNASQSDYFAALGYTFPENLEERAQLLNDLYQDVEANIGPIVLLLDPTDEAISDKKRVIRFVALSDIIGNYTHDHTDALLANNFIRTALNLEGCDSSYIAQRWSGNQSIIRAVAFGALSSSLDDVLQSLREDNSYVMRFVNSLIELKKKQNIILDRLGFSSAEEYFARQQKIDGINLGRYELKKPSHRKKLFNKLHDKRNSEAALLALDPFNDITDADIIRDLGFLLQWPDSGIYTPEISEPLFTYGALHFAEDGDFAPTMCAFRLGHHYWSGNTGRIDHNAAVFWFDIAMKLGHGVAPKFMYQILASEDKRFGDPNEAEFNAYMDSLMKKVEDMGFPCSVEWLNRRYAYGAGEYNDQKRVVAGYESVIDEQFLAPPQLSSLMAYAMRSILLDNVGRTYDDIISNIHVGVEKRGLQSFYTSDLEVPLGHVNEIRKKLTTSNEYASHFRTMADAIAVYYSQDASDEQFEAAIDHEIDTASSIQTEAYRDALWLGRQLALEEGWFIRRKISTAFEKVHAKCLSLDETELKRSAMIMGPFYNAINPNNALPILGEYSPASQSEEEVEVQRVTLGAYTPQPGISSIEAVTGENGSIKFDFKSDHTSPALILEQDIDISMALVFGDPQKPIWPSLSLESKDDDLLPDEYKEFTVKVWNPDWLGHTDYGRTLYTVDRMTGQLTWASRSFTIANPEDSFDPAFPEYVRNFIEDLRFTGGADRSSHSKMINVSPEYIPLKIEKPHGEKGPWRVPLPVKRMRINGAYTQGDDVRDIGWNDTTFGQGRLTQRLTDHYPDISAMMPVFERARQITAMTYGLMKLRNEGFQLSRPFQSQASDTLNYYRSLPPLPRNQRVMKKQPFKLDFVR